MASDKHTVVKKFPNGVLFSDGMIRVDNVRCSYPHLLEPYEGEDDEGKKQLSYGIVLLLPKRTYGAARDVCNQRIAECMKEKQIKAIADDKKFLRDGDASGKAEHMGHWTVSAREVRKPVLRAPSKARVQAGETVMVDGKPVPAEELFYGGCYVNAMIRPWGQNNKHGKRVNCGIVAVQFVKHGEPFGEGRISEEDIDDSFDALEDDEHGFGDEGESEREGELVGADDDL